MTPADLPDQGLCMAALQAVRAEMEQITCAKRIQRTLASHIPGTSVAEI
jgi:hypothetical protein